MLNPKSQQVIQNNKRLGLWLRFQ